MNLKKRILAAFLVVVMIFGALYLVNTTKEEDLSDVFDTTPTIRIWYTDEMLNDYLATMAVRYNEEKGIRVIPVLQSGLQLLEKINEASLADEDTPDLFIATNDIIEKAFLTGLAMPIDNSDGAVGLSNFPESALYAVTYRQQILGYPFYYETSALLYNRTYLEDLAYPAILERIELQKNAFEGVAGESAEEGKTADNNNSKDGENNSTDENNGNNEENSSIDTGEDNIVENENGEVKTDTENTGQESEGSEAVEEATKEAVDKNLRQREEIKRLALEAGISTEVLEELVSEKVLEMIPDTFESLLEFADNYDAPENVEAVFKWDVADIFYNYFFIGNYIDVGGAFGDNVNSINIYNENAIKALRVYQKLSDYFAIDAESVDYSSVIEDFMDGKIVMTTATTDIVGKLEWAAKNGEFDYEYGIATIPRLTDEMDTRGMSVTNAIYINGYSDMKAEANDFARYLTLQNADALYGMTGKMTANKHVKHYLETLDMFMNEYQDSAPLAKMMAASNLPIKMEIMFDKVWNGEDISQQLKLLSEDIKTQITGEPYEEAYIQVEEEEEEYIEYSED